MTIDLIPAENAREIRAAHAAITPMITGTDATPTDFAAAQFGFIVLDLN